MIARGRTGLESTAAEVRRLGGEALVVPCDVADADALERAATLIEERLGEIDVWVNNAMTAVLGEVADTTAEEFRRVTEVTYLGQVHGTQAALRRMLPRDRGHVILVGSALGYRGIPLQATYCGAKHAVQGFFESLRTELLHRGAKVGLTIVQLPGLNTTQFHWVRLHVPHEPQPVPPIYQPEVAARAITWAADHPHRREVWVGGSTAMTILGNRVGAWVADRYLARTGFGSQQTDHEAGPDRGDYLEAPLDDDRDHGFHGAFDDQAKDRSYQLWLATHRPVVAGVAGAAAGALVAGLRRWAAAS